MTFFDVFLWKSSNQRILTGFDTYSRDQFSLSECFVLIYLNVLRHFEVKSVWRNIMMMNYSFFSRNKTKTESNNFIYTYIHISKHTSCILDRIFCMELVKKVWRMISVRLFHTQIYSYKNILCIHKYTPPICRNVKKPLPEHGSRLSQTTYKTLLVMRYFLTRSQLPMV